MDKRHERMLEDLLKAPGNDCHTPHPRWASVNLGVFLCVSCASIHRKLGTHRSRVKSVTLDDWSRDQIANMRQMGNTASNAIWNPNEALHPPPHSVSGDERDSDMEKYIRRKYEQGAFKAGAGPASSRPAPTSLNRARERDGRLPQFGGDTEGKNGYKERDLPALPHETQSTPPARDVAPPRVPAVAAATSRSAPPPPSAPPLVDLSGSSSSTLPLQLNSQPVGGPSFAQNGLSGMAGGSGSMSGTPLSWSGSNTGMTGSYGMASSSSSTGGYNAPPMMQQGQVQMMPNVGAGLGQQDQQAMLMQQQHLQAQFPASAQYQSFQQLQPAPMQMSNFGSSPYGQSPLAMGLQHGMMTGMAQPIYQQQQQQQYMPQQQMQYQQQFQQTQQPGWQVPHQQQQHMMVGLNGQYGGGMMR